MHPTSVEDLAREHRRLEALAADGGDGPGRATTLGWDLEGTTPGALCAFVDQIVFRRMNDFVAESDRPVILDCGANIGYTVLHYKRQFPGARITAFEPDPQFAPILRRNLGRNGARDVEIVEAAAWIADGRARWAMEGRDGSRLVSGTASGERAVEVATVNLARHLAQDVDLLKLDIEGAEFDVVPHLASRLDRVRNILIECHIVDQSKYAGLARILTTLEAARFKISLNSYGPWRDLTRRHVPAAMHAEQYLTVVGWRTEAAAVSRGETYLPYVSLSHYRALVAPAESAAEDAARALAGLVTEPDAWAVCHVDGPFRQDGGACWTWRFPEPAPTGDSPAGQASTTILLEDDRVLGQGHAQHDDIRRMGRGRYSHWGGQLYFAASDDSNPNTNGRRYTAVYRRLAPRADTATAVDGRTTAAASA